MTSSTTFELKDSAQEQEFSKPKNKCAQLISHLKPFVPKASNQESGQTSNLPRTDDECFRNPTPYNVKPSTSFQVGDQCSISIEGTSLSSYTLPPPSTYSTTVSPDKREKCLHFQQSLLSLIHLHLLQRHFESSISVTQQSLLSIEPYSIHDNFLRLKQETPTFYKKVGYVSQHFFESALLATKMFFQTSTFKVESEDLHQLSSLSSFSKLIYILFFC
ncbi:hypothetical protein GEMRC1_013578 [Eukaryota sp. GEM-RC1]